MPTSCLVTGGAGFIGSHLVRRLLADGHRVAVLDDLSTGKRENLAEVAADVRLVVGDLRDAAACRDALAGCELVFHLAARGSVPRSLADPLGTHDVNVNGTVTLLEAARAAGARRVVFASSSSAYGDTPTLPKVETMEPLPRSPYAASKLSAEQYVLAWARGGLLEGVALRYFNIFGPRQDPAGPYAAVIPRWMQAARDGGVATVLGDGGQTRDFTYVDNAVEANVLAATRPADAVSGWVMNCGAGARTSLLELLASIEAAAGRPVRREHAPSRAGDVRDSLASLERARERLGYAPSVDVGEGIRRTWSAFTAA
ncbi:MAG: NAD-dependent epimerase/dehydratase family protein [Gemmatimonadales bacterium]|nr:NAD-dependent epimerase/dehydratase family protein [Gemmatimonadales bacterium]